ncbi:MAG: hypothetical protein NT072_11105 [Deltaproteobacteria bacterium]|nr:hypothetical protein [Deltaproteobacteria bacterium]
MKSGISGYSRGSSGAASPSPSSRSRPYFLKGTIYARVTGLVGILVFLLGLISLVHRSFVNEIFSLSVAVMFIMMIVYCFIHRSAGVQVRV